MDSKILKLILTEGELQCSMQFWEKGFCAQDYTHLYKKVSFQNVSLFSLRLKDEKQVKILSVYFLL
jgi:hypothetical protein